MRQSPFDDKDIKIFYDHKGVKREVLISYEKFLAILDLLEDREDELDSVLGKRIAEERKAYKRGEGRGREAYQ